jgi:hypothetical protein
MPELEGSAELQPWQWTVRWQAFSQPFGLCCGFTPVSSAALEAYQQAPFGMIFGVLLQMALESLDRFPSAAALGKERGSLQWRRAEGTRHRACQRCRQNRGD